jgi:hypothetical protein
LEAFNALFPLIGRSFSGLQVDSKGSNDRKLNLDSDPTMPNIELWKGHITFSKVSFKAYTPLSTIWEFQINTPTYKVQKKFDPLAQYFSSGVENIYRHWNNRWTEPKPCRHFSHGFHQIAISSFKLDGASKICISTAVTAILIKETQDPRFRRKIRQ